MTKSLTSALLALLISFGLPASADAAELLILKSTESSLPEGGIIDSAATLSIPAGAKLTLVGEAGSKITLEGPYSGVPAASEPAAEDGLGSRMLMALSRLIVGTPPDPTALGATRGGAVAVADDVWPINVSLSGDHCLRTDLPPTFWRAATDNAATLAVKRLRQSWVKTDWPAGRASLGWPGGVDLIDDATYLVRHGSGITVTKVIVHLMPGDLPSDFHRAAWMAEHGCLRQARSLMHGAG